MRTIGIQNFIFGFNYKIMTEMANTCDQSITSMKSEAIKINNLMTVQKSTITWNVSRFQKLLDQFKMS